MSEYDKALEESNRRLQELAKADFLMRVRADIAQSAGDTQTLLGTTSDAVQLLLYGFCMLVRDLNTANSLADVRNSTVGFESMASDFLQKIESGKVKMPFQLKGVDSVIGDIEKRGTAVAESIANSDRFKLKPVSDDERELLIEKCNNGSKQ